MKKKSSFKAYLAWILVCIIWGTNYLAIRVGVEDLPPMLFNGLRWISAGFIFLVFLKIKGVKLPPKDELIHVAIPGVLLLGISSGLVVAAEQWINSSLTALILSAEPLVMYGVLMLLPQSPKLSLKTLFGLFLGFSGVSLIFLNDFDTMFKGQDIIGLIFLFVSMITWTTGTIYSKYKQTSVPPFMRAAIQMLIAGLGQTIIGLLLGEQQRFVFQTNSFLAFLYLVFIASILGYGAYIYAVTNLPISLVSTHSYINTILALFLGWFLLDEQINIKIIIAAIIIIFGVILVKKKNTE